MTTRVTNDNIDLSSITNAFVEWQAVITADGSTTTNVEAGKGYIIDTSSFSHTITLPSSPKTGDTISVKDYADSFNLNSVTVNLNGSKIEGNVSTNTFLKDERGSYILFYVDNTKGWSIFNESASTNFSLSNYIAATGGTLIEDGSYNVHVFKNDGCFTVTNTGPGASTVDYVVVAGGGGGGNGPPAAGGGGAGGYRTNYPSCCTGLPVTTTTYPITVGGGGLGSCAQDYDSTPGSNSIFSTITSAGGGGGGANPGPAQPLTYPGGGKNGGSGGGAGPSACSIGSGNTPPTSPSQGNPGGTAGPVPTPGTVGGGGGGAGAAGSSAPGFGHGGIGASTGIFGCLPALKIKCYGTPGPAPGRYFAGGGGGSRNTPGPVRRCAATQLNASPSAAGGGGRGSCGKWEPNSSTPLPAGETRGGPGTANTGGGGGGGGDNSGNTYNPNSGDPGGNGGKGIVILRYKAR